MYRLKVDQHFAAAHQLRGYKGLCEALHGHNWKVEVVVEGLELDSVGMLIDFKELKDLIQKIIGELDHKFLNEHPAFQKDNPSSELLSRFIYRELKALLPSGIAMVSVRVWESENASAEYFE